MCNFQNVQALPGFRYILSYFEFRCFYDSFIEFNVFAISSLELVLFFLELALDEVGASLILWIEDSNSSNSMLREV
jgi:hypothetical protein